MKNLIVKIVLILPVVLFAYYILMALVGSVAGLLHCSDAFYCGPFCEAGKILGGLTVFLFFFLILPDIRAFLNIHKHAPSEKK